MKLSTFVAGSISDAPQPEPQRDIEAIKAAMRAKRPQDRDGPDKHPRPNYWLDDLKKMQKADARWQKRFLDRQYQNEMAGLTIAEANGGGEDDGYGFDRSVQAFEQTRMRHHFYSGPPPDDFSKIDLQRHILMHSSQSVVVRTVGGLCVDHRNFAQVVRRPERVVLPRPKTLCQEISM